MLERLGAPRPLGHPVEELLAVAAEARAWLEVLREQVAELNTLATTDIAHVERARAVVDLYGQAMDRTERVLVNLLKLDLDARRLRLAEEQAKIIKAAVDAALRVPELDLAPEQQITFRRALGQQLRALDGPAS